MNIDKLCLRAEQIGFHLAVPKNWKESRGERLGWNFPLPPILAGFYLVEVMDQIGYTRPMDQGRFRAIDDTDLFHYNSNRGVLCEAWEFDALIEMSKSYIKGHQLGLDEFAISPMDQLSRSDEDD